MARPFFLADGVKGRDTRLVKIGGEEIILLSGVIA